MMKKNIGIALCGILIFIFGWYLGGKDNAFAGTSLARPTSISESDFALYIKALAILDAKHPDAESITSQDRVWASIEGLAKSYGDPYTTFFNPEANKLFGESINGEFSGVGMEIDIEEGYLTVISPLKNSPAEKAGLLPGDIVIEIDGTSTLDMTLDEAVKNIRGPQGEEVVLTVVREGEKNVLSFTIVRDIIELVAVETEDRKGGVFLISIYSFTDDIQTMFDSAMKEFLASGDSKLILDLRNNPGGYLASSIDIASWFVEEGEVVVTEQFSPQSGRKDIVYRSKGNDSKLPRDFEMVVLVNGGSASASEIVAGALQEYGIATLVGTKTFGKGSVQEYIPLDAHSAIKVTVAKWLTPQGNSIQDNGLTPDYEIEYDATSTEDAVLLYAENLLKN